MQLLILPYVIAMTSYAYHTASALVVPFHLPADQNQTVAQAVLISPANRTNLAASEFWPIEGDYWLELEKTNTYMDLQYVYSVLARAQNALGKKQADQHVKGIFSVTANKEIEPHNEYEFVYAAAPGKVSSWEEASLALKGLSTWYQQEPLQGKKFATYFYLVEGGKAKEEGVLGYGALKRVWQPFPPAIGGNVSVSR